MFVCSFNSNYATDSIIPSRILDTKKKGDKSVWFRQRNHVDELYSCCSRSRYVFFPVYRNIEVAKARKRFGVWFLFETELLHWERIIWRWKERDGGFQSIAVCFCYVIKIFCHEMKNTRKRLLIKKKKLLKRDEFSYFLGQWLDFYIALVSLIRIDCSTVSRVFNIRLENFCHSLKLILIFISFNSYFEEKKRWKMKVVGRKIISTSDIQ